MGILLIIIFYTTGLNFTNDTNEIISKIKYYIKNEEFLNNLPSNDALIGMQYYLNDLKISDAWKKVTNSKEVIVAVIDDGIDQNHPDLVNSIWTSKTAKYGDSKTINFVGDGINGAVGEHGTMVAGIIGATINNNEGIAGIAKKVKIMPLKVFGSGQTANTDDINKAINYAIDNGANIINLSLGGNQDYYTDAYDETIKKAYDKGVVIVIAAGNGDWYRFQEVGINLNNNPISPVCNNGGNNKYTIGVYAGDMDGYRTNWTNYGDCTPFMAPGVGIVSTSIPMLNSTYGTDYNIADGTSFSAPMITGIIALGYNQYGQIPPSVVIESLNASLVKNSVGNYIVDASKYIDNLGINKSKISTTTTATTQTIKSETTVSTNNEVVSENVELSNGDYLANKGIITKRDNQADYRENDFVLRQEVVGMAIKVMGKNLDEGYQCRNIFKDVSSVKPNNWACRAIEISSDFGVVSIVNQWFRPEDRITRAEALAMIMKAANISGSDSQVSSFSDVSVEWQVKLINKALELGIVDKTINFRPNENATRGEIFEIAKRVLSAK